MRTPRASPSGSIVTQLQELRAGRLGDRDHHVVRRAHQPRTAMRCPLLVVLIEVTLPSSHGDRPRRGDPVRGVGARRRGAVSAADHAGPDLPRVGRRTARRPPRAGAPLGCRGGRRRRRARRRTGPAEAADRRSRAARLVRRGRRRPGRRPWPASSPTLRRGTSPAPTPTAAFWRRRQAVETAVHRWDAEHAVGTAVAGRRPSWRPTASTSSSPCWRPTASPRPATASTSAARCTSTAPTSTASGRSTPTTASTGSTGATPRATWPCGARRRSCCSWSSNGSRPDADGIEVFGAPEVLDRWLALGTL